MTPEEHFARLQEARQSDDEWLEWYRMTPLERWAETCKLWQFYLSVGGSLDPEVRSTKSFRRCQHTDASGMRLDVMSRLRGCDPFDRLWERRMTVEHNDGTRFELLDIEDLVQAKKTQRDKDWPMITRLVDAHYEQFQHEPSVDRVRFWLRESRSPDALIRLTAEFPELHRELLPQRPLLDEAPGASRTALLQGARGN